MTPFSPEKTPAASDRLVFFPNSRNETVGSPGGQKSRENESLGARGARGPSGRKMQISLTSETKKVEKTSVLRVLETKILEKTTVFRVLEFKIFEKTIVFRDLERQRVSRESPERLQSVSRANS